MPVIYFQIFIGLRCIFIGSTCIAVLDHETSDKSIKNQEGICFKRKSYLDTKLMMTLVWLIFAHLLIYPGWLGPCCSIERGMEVIVGWKTESGWLMTWSTRHVQLLVLPGHWKQICKIALLVQCISCCLLVSFFLLICCSHHLSLFLVRSVEKPRFESTSKLCSISYIYLVTKVKDLKSS